MFFYFALIGWNYVTETVIKRPRRRIWPMVVILSVLIGLLGGMIFLMSNTVEESELTAKANQQATNQAVVNQHHTANALCALGLSHVQAQAWQEAVDTLEMCIANDVPDYADDLAVAHYNLGRNYNLAYDYTAAIEAYSRAITLLPDYVEAYYARGLAYHDQGEYDAALADYTYIIETLNPNYAYAYAGRGYTYFMNQELDTALFEYQRAIEIDPTYTTAYCSVGYIGYLQEDWQLAVEYLEVCLAANANSPFADELATARENLN